MSARTQTPDEALEAAQTARTEAAAELVAAEEHLADVRRRAQAGDRSVIPEMGPAAGRLDFARLADAGAAGALREAEEAHVWSVDRQMQADVLEEHGTDAEHDPKMRALIDQAVGPLSELLLAVHRRNAAIERLRGRQERTRTRFGLEAHPDTQQGVRLQSRDMEEVAAVVLAEALKPLDATMDYWDRGRLLGQLGPRARSVAARDRAAFRKPPEPPA